MDKIEPEILQLICKGLWVGAASDKWYQIKNLLSYT